MSISRFRMPIHVLYAIIIIVSDTRSIFLFINLLRDMVKMYLTVKTGITKLKASTWFFLN